MKTTPEQSQSLSKSSNENRALDLSYTLNSNSSSNLSLRNVTNLDNLTNILMNKSSPTHSIGYLGSAILTKGKTGLGCLQQPLRELYCIFRKNGSRLMQERRLAISIDGLTMLYNDKGVEKFIHNDLSSVYDVQLLHLVSDYKKRNYAFLPVDQDQASKRYANLFQPLDRSYASFIENSVHPPVIALIMRRSCGIQALECHVIITRTSEDAFKIVNDIKSVCHRFKRELNQQNNVFDYKSEAGYAQIRPGRSLSQLPPKSPAVKSTKANSDEIYDAFEDTNESRISSKSSTDLAGKPSIFNKIKNFKSSDSKKKSLSSNSEIIFNDSAKVKNKSTSSMVNISDNARKDKKKSSLKQESLSSLNQSDADVEKKVKKLSIGKRILNSARSSLKSSSKNDKKLASSSATSFGSVSSRNSKKEMEKIADVDFRRMGDRNLLINKSSHSLAMAQSSCTARPTNICLENRINLIPSSPANSTRMNNYCKNRSQLAPSPNKLLIPEYSKTTLENSVNFNKLDESKYQKKVLKLPVPDAKLLSNHLIWNKEIGSAECVDKQELHYQAKHMSPVAKVMSSGGTSNCQSFSRLKSEEENRYRSKSQTNGYVYRPQPPTSLVPEINYSSLRENTTSYLHDSAYYSTSNASKVNDSEQNEEICNLKSQNIVMNRLKQQYEMEQERKSILSITSGHKIIGGVKVFPTLPQEFRLAAEKRQKRMTEIENNLKKASIEDSLKDKNEVNNYPSAEIDNDEAEIIDLTINKEEINESKMNSSLKEIPIEIVPKKFDNEDFRPLSLKWKNHYSNEINMKQDVDECKSEQINFVYYYDNQQFAGY